MQEDQLLPLHILNKLGYVWLESNKEKKYIKKNGFLMFSFIMKNTK